MAYSIDSILINFLKRKDENPLLPYSSKIALIGEDSPRGTKGSLKYRLKKLGYKDIQVFTKRKIFIPTDACNFDVLIAVRLCDKIPTEETAEEVILKTAFWTSKKFIIIPCNCDNVHKKVLGYIRRYYQITGIWTGPEEFTNRSNGPNAWYVLHNL